MSDTIDIGLHVCDRQLLDKDGRRCGKVDDLAIDGGPGEDAEVTAILVGSGVVSSRAGWFGPVIRRLTHASRMRIPWDEVADVHEHVKLKRTAVELGLGRGDDRLRPLVDRVPGADK